MGRRGSAPGERRGGRQKGTPNKKTVLKKVLVEALREPEAAQAVGEIFQQKVVPQRGKKRGTDLMEDYMLAFAGLAARYQPRDFDENGRPKSGDEDKFLKFGAAAVDAASKLAKFQSPTFKAVAIAAPPPDLNGAQAPAPERDGRRSFTLTIFDDMGRRLQNEVEMPTPGERGD